MKTDIVSKLNGFLDDLSWKESEVVYFCVEVRKLLEHRGDAGRSDYLTLRFYCDWAVHTSKDWATPVMKVIMGKIANDFLQNPKTPAKTAIEFVSMAHLRTDLHTFLDDYKITSGRFSGDHWLSFQKTLSDVLTDQPLKAPVPEVVEFRFRKGVRGLLVWEILFERDMISGTLNQKDGAWVIFGPKRRPYGAA